MSEFTPLLGSFTAYLESTQKGKSETAAAPASPITVLKIVSHQPQRAMAMADLQKLSGMDSTRFRSVMKMDLAYVTVEGPALDAAVTLTAKGGEAAALARPATSGWEDWVALALVGGMESRWQDHGGFPTGWRHRGRWFRFRFEFRRGDGGRRAGARFRRA